MKIAELKIKLLIYGIQIDFDSIKSLTYKSDKYQHNNRHYKNEFFNNRIPQEIELFSKEDNTWIIVGVLLRQQSPYKLSFTANRLSLYYNKELLEVDIRLLKEPTVWSNITSDGQPMHRLISIPGNNEINLWTWHDCGFQLEKMGCAFCTTTNTSKMLQNNHTNDLLCVKDLKNLSQSYILNEKYNLFLKNAIEAITTVLKKDYLSKDYWLTIIGGNLPLSMLNINVEFVAKLIHDIIITFPFIDTKKLGCNIMPPNDLKLIHYIKQSGAGFFMMNLEIWNDLILKKVCPGKSSYGKKNYLDAMACAVQEFGIGNVWSNFVCGIEPMETQLCGFKELSSMGVVPGANILHKDPGSSANYFKEFTMQDYQNFYYEAANILLNHGLKPFYSLSSRRSSLLWEAYLGIL